MEGKIKGGIKGITEQMNEIKKRIKQELEVRVGEVEKKAELRMEDRLGEFEMELVAQFREMETKTAKGFELEGRNIGKNRRGSNPGDQNGRKVGRRNWVHK